MQHIEHRGLQKPIELELSDARSDASEFAEILNDIRAKEPDSEVIKLAKDLREIERLAAKAGFPKYPYKGWLRRKTDPLFKRISPIFDKVRYELGWPSEWGWQETIAAKVKDIPLGFIIIAARQGFLRHIDECHLCGGWFLSRKRDHKFCSSECREKAFRKSDEGRAKRAAYMKRYREGLRRLEQNYLRDSKRRS
jgi:hypothetical protein